jgi:phosphoenolpyruvate carboxylase
MVQLVLKPSAAMCFICQFAELLVKEMEIASSQSCKWVIGWCRNNVGLPTWASLGTGLGTNLGSGAVNIVVLQKPLN